MISLMYDARIRENLISRNDRTQGLRSDIRFTISPNSGPVLDSETLIVTHYVEADGHVLFEIVEGFPGNIPIRHVRRLDLGISVVLFQSSTKVVQSCLQKVCPVPPLVGPVKANG